MSNEGQDRQEEGQEQREVRGAFYDGLKVIRVLRQFIAVNRMITALLGDPIVDNLERLLGLIRLREAIVRTMYGEFSLNENIDDEQAKLERSLKS